MMSTGGCKTNGTAVAEEGGMLVAPASCVVFAVVSVGVAVGGLTGSPLAVAAANSAKPTLEGGVYAVWRWLSATTVIPTTMARSATPPPRNQYSLRIVFLAMVYGCKAGMVPRGSVFGGRSAS